LGEIGRCGVPDKIFLARAALHHWEEPIISGSRGSGTVFFSGCSLGCVYCQNREISRADIGKEVSLSRLSDIMLDLQSQGAHNVNLVTPTHYAPSIIYAVKSARQKGLVIPIVYNTSSYDSVSTVKSLDGTVDVYLADLKYHTADLAESYSFARNYPEAAKNAIEEMVKQKGRAVIDNGIMSSGIIVRILLLPGHLAQAKLSLSYLLSKYGDDIYISLMSQYTPMPGVPAPLNRRVTLAEYESLCDYAIKKGLKNGFIQEGESAKESFIPSFDYTGI
jgi:putative pyruvate formate lyase activating enzyme